MKHLYYFMEEGVSLKMWEQDGVITRELAILDALIDRGWEVTFITYDRERPPTVKTKAVIWPKWPFGFLRGSLWPIYNWLMPIFRYPPYKTRKNAVIMTNTAMGGWPALIAKKIWKTPFVARAGYIFGEQATKFKELTAADRKNLRQERQIYLTADFGIVPTEELKKWVIENYKMPEHLLNVIPNYVDTDVFFPLKNIQRQRTVLLIARLHEDKRIPLVIEALAGTDIVLDIVGDGSIKNELIECANKFGVHLNLLGRIENEKLPVTMASAGCYVISGLTEGHPRALVEAMAAAMPCIGVHGQGINNVLTDSENGLLVEPNPEKLRQAILSVLDNPDLAARLGESALDFALKHYSLENIAKEYDRLLSSLIK